MAGVPTRLLPSPPAQGEDSTPQESSAVSRMSVSGLSLQATEQVAGEGAVQMSSQLCVPQQKAGSDSRGLALPGALWEDMCFGPWAAPKFSAQRLESQPAQISACPHPLQIW